MNNSDKALSAKAEQCCSYQPPIRVRPVAGDITPLSEFARKNVFAHSSQRTSKHALSSSIKPLTGSFSQPSLPRKRPLPTESLTQTPVHARQCTPIGKSASKSQQSTQYNLMHSIEEENATELSEAIVHNQSVLSFSRSNKEKTCFLSDTMEWFRIPHQFNDYSSEQNRLMKQQTTEQLYEKLSLFKIKNPYLKK